MNFRTNGTAQSVEKETTTTVVAWPPHIGEAGLYGIAGDFVRLVKPYTEADPNAILLSFLSYAGHLLGRNYYLPAGADKHCGNIFVCLVGTTATGRKGSAMNAAELFYTEGKFAPGLKHVFRGISSGEAMIWKIKDAVNKKEWDKESKTFKLTPVEEEEPEKRSIYTLSEFQQVIANWKRSENILSVVLRQAWEKDVLESPSKHLPSKSTGAHISLLGGISKDELRLETTANDAQNGTLNRFLFAVCKRWHLLPEGDSLYKLTQSPKWQELQEVFRFNIREEIDEQGNPVPPRQVERTDEAQDAWGHNGYETTKGGLYEKLNRPRPGLWGLVTARGAQHVMRLSLIQAIINGHRQIEVADQNAALEIWRYCDHSAKYIWGDTTDPIAGKILERIRESQLGLNRTDIYDFLGHHVTKGQIENSLNWLHSRGLAFSESRNGNGRPSETWFPVL